MQERGWRKCAEACGLATLVGVACVAIGAKDDSIRLKNEANTLVDYMAETNVYTPEMRENYAKAQQKLVDSKPNPWAFTYRVVGATLLIGGTMGAFYCGMRSLRTPNKLYL